MKELILRTEALTVGYQGRPVVRQAELSLRPGEILALIGPNGAGKSTLLKGLIRQLAPMAGTVYLKGQALERLSGNQLAREMAVVLTPRIDPELMTVWDVVSAGRYPYTGRLGLLTETDRRAVAQAMELVHLSELAQTPFAQLSDGQRQRTLLARAICQEPEVLVLDEPTSYLDIRHKLELLSILHALARQRQVAVILTLHELELAQKCATQVLCIRDGAIVRTGTPEEIFQGRDIEKLFQLDRGSYDAHFGTLELEAPQGAPRVFVIGGGGTGIGYYRRLQRLNCPFAAGVLHENDVELPVAQALAAQVVTTPAFEPITEGAYRQALARMERCRWVLCTLTGFGSVNEKNRLLLQQAQSQGKLTDWDTWERSDGL